jgi:hypothetical protein
MLTKDKFPSRAEEELARRQGQDPYQRATRWYFTVNNFTDEEVQACRRMYELEAVECGTVEREVGEAEGTPHLQGFVVFRERRSRSQVKRMLGGRVHKKMAETMADETSNYREIDD